MPQITHTPNLTIHQIEVVARNQNINFVVQHKDTDAVMMFDPSPEPETLIAYMKEQKLHPTTCYITHHHWDHVDGIEPLKAEFDFEVVGFDHDAHRIPHIDRTVSEDERFEWENVPVQVMFLPGHTTGIIAYYMPSEGIIFPADVVFGAGCGRMFEGTYEQYFNSLQAVKTLPPETKIYCAHEYTQTNCECAVAFAPNDNAYQARLEKVKALRKQDTPTVPLSLAEELETNPALRAETVEEFQAWREFRNGW